VCIPPGKAVPEMTYTVSGGTLNPSHSLCFDCMFYIFCFNLNVFDIYDYKFMTFCSLY